MANFICDRDGAKPGTAESHVSDPEDPGSLLHGGRRSVSEHRRAGVRMRGPSKGRASLISVETHVLIRHEPFS